MSLFLIAASAPVETSLQFDAMMVIKMLTMLSLGGLLLAVGLRVSWREVRDALRKARLGWVLAANFLLVPLLTMAAVRVFAIPIEIGVGMLLLAAAPFAPVVPVFTRLARGDLALAVGLTAFFPFVAAFVTPWICQWSLDLLTEPGLLEFSSLEILLILFLTITLPLGVGTLFQHVFPRLGQQLLRPVEVISEAAGACSLAFVTIVEFGTILAVGWQSLLLMALIFEISLWLGYAASRGARASRMVVAVGTSNRNIALAILIAIGSFPHTGVPGAVVANGLMMILLGLVHVGWWRWTIKA